MLSNKILVYGKNDLLDYLIFYAQSFPLYKGVLKNSSETDRKILGFAAACDFRAASFRKDR